MLRAILRYRGEKLRLSATHLRVVRSEHGVASYRDWSRRDVDARWVAARRGARSREHASDGACACAATKYGRTDRMTDGGTPRATESGDSRDTGSHSPTHFQARSSTFSLPPLPPRRILFPHPWSAVVRRRPSVGIPCVSAHARWNRARVRTDTAACFSFERPPESGPSVLNLPMYTYTLGISLSLRGLRFQKSVRASCQNG